LLWFLKGDSHVSTLNHSGVTIWNKDTYNFYLKMYEKYPLGKEKLTFEQWEEKQKTTKPTHSGDAGRHYGVQWRSWTQINQASIDGLAVYSSFDQIQTLLDNLRKPNPINRRHIVTAWNPAELDQTALPPCHWAFEVIPRPLSYTQRIEYSGGDKVYLETLWSEGIGKNNQEAKDLLEDNLKHVPKWGFTLKWHQRSVDTFLGLPFNIASYALLAYIIGSIVDMVPLTIIGDLSNVHFYTKPENSESKSHIELVKEQLSRNPNAFKGPQLSFSENYLQELNLYKTGSISFDAFINTLSHEDFVFENYESFGAIKGDMYEPTA